MFSQIIPLLLHRVGMSALSAAVHAPYKTSLAASASEAVSALESEWLDADSTSDAALSSS